MSAGSSDSLSPLALGMDIPRHVRRQLDWTGAEVADAVEDDADDDSDDSLGDSGGGGDGDDGGGDHPR